MAVKKTVAGIWSWRARLALLALLQVVPAIADDGSERAYRIDRPHPVTDPAYGDILYYYYQRQNFAAMSAILVALDRGALPQQSERARVLLGALYADYAMPGEAERLFDTLLAEAVDQSLANRIWIYLADIYYRRGQYQKALDILDARVVSAPDDLQQHFLTLRTRVLMKLGRYADTRETLDALETGTVSAYLRYNLAVSRINAGEGEQGTRLLWELVNLPPGDAEINALKDKAMLALGVHYLRTGQGERARHLLGAARLDGPYSEMALLLHGRAWLAGDSPRTALSSLQALSKRSMQFEEAQEAGLALPFLYEKLNDLPRARDAYRASIRAYTDHFSYLSALDQKIRSGEWFQQLVGDGHWSTAMDPLPVFEPARVDSFATFRSLFASHAFQKYWRAYHEQQRQVHLVQRWSQRLPALDQLLAAHIRKHRSDIPDALALLAEVNAHGSEQALQSLRERLARAYQDMNAKVLALPQERQWLEQLALAREKAGKREGKLPAEKADQLALYQGLVTWQVLSRIEPRRWQYERRLQALDDELARSLLLRENVKRLTEGDISRVTDLGHALAGLHNELGALDQRGRQLLARLQRVIEGLALTQVQQTRERLQFFTAECWAALGDLQHRAVKERMKQNLSGQAPGSKSSE